MIIKYYIHAWNSQKIIKYYIKSLSNMYKETSKISYYLPSISVLGISHKLNLITEKILTKIFTRRSEGASLETKRRRNGPISDKSHAQDNIECPLKCLWRVCDEIWSAYKMKLKIQSLQDRQYVQYDYKRKKTAVIILQNSTTLIEVERLTVVGTSP